MKVKDEYRQPLIQRILAIGVILLLIVSPTQFSIEPFKDVHITLADIILLLMFPLWAFYHIKFIRTNILSLIPVPVILFVVMVAASCVFGAKVSLKSVKECIQYLEYFIIAFCIISNTTTTKADLDRNVVTFFIVTGVIVTWASIHYMTSSIEPLQVRASFGNRNVLGGYFSLALPLAFGCMLFERSLIRLALLLVCIVIGLCTNLSGASVLAISVAFLIISMLRGVKFFIITGFIMLILFVFLMPSLPRNNTNVWYDSIALYDAGGEVTPRYPEWQAGVTMVRKHPVLGVGPGRYQDNIGRFYGQLPDRTGPSEPDTQNLYLVLASSCGLLCVVFFAGIMIFFVLQAMRCFFITNNVFYRGIAAGCAGAIVAYAINCIWAPLLVRGIGIPLVTVMAFIAVLEKLVETDKQSRECPINT